MNYRWIWWITLIVVEKNHVSLILKTTRNCRMYVIFRLCFLSKGLHHPEMYSSCVLCLSRNTPWSSWPTWSTSASAPTSTKRPDRNSWQLLMTLTVQKDKWQQATQAGSMITMEICYNYGVISLQCFTPDIRLLPLYIFVWMLFNATVHQYQFFWMC